MKCSILAATVLLAIAGAAQAEIISPIADLTDGAPRTGNFVSGVDNFNAPETWRVHTFSANAGDNINIRVSRLTGFVDPVATAHFGDLTGADVTSDYDMFDLSDYGVFFVASGDDNVDDPFGGPFGDPNFNFTASDTGTYTVITHMFGDYPENPPYEIQVRGSTVPAPGAVTLAGAGGLLALRRRRR